MLVHLLLFVFLCSEHYYTHRSKWQFSPVGRHARDRYYAYSKMGKCSTLQRYLDQPDSFKDCCIKGTVRGWEWSLHGLRAQPIFLPLLSLNASLESIPRLSQTWRGLLNSRRREMQRPELGSAPCSASSLCAHQSPHHPGLLPELLLAARPNCDHGMF